MGKIANSSRYLRILPPKNSGIPNNQNEINPVYYKIGEEVAQRVISKTFRKRETIRP